MLAELTARAVLVVGAITPFANAIAQTPGGGGGGGSGTPTDIDIYIPLYNIEYGASLGGLNTDQRTIKELGWHLSGNKVEFLINVGTRLPGAVPGGCQPPPGFPSGIDASLYDVRIYIGGELVKELDGPYEMDVPFALYAPGTTWRIATTKWQDGGVIPIRVEATFDFVFQNQDQSTFEVNDVQYTETFNFIAHNKMQHLGTPLLPNGQTNQGFIDASTGIVQAAFNGLPTHSKSPADAEDTLEVQKAAVAAGTSDHTVIVCATHGSTGYFYDSDGWDGMSDPQNSQMTFLSEILPLARVIPAAGQSGKNDQQPLYNLIVFYSCKAFAAGYCAEAYQVYGALARGGAGFAKNVWNLCIKRDTLTLVGVNAHAAVFFQKLAGGENLGNAQDQADQAYWVLDDSGDVSINPATGVPNAAQPMETKGDTFTRLKYVYLTPLEKLYLGTGNWNIDILELPVQPPGGGQQP